MHFSILFPALLPAVALAVPLVSLAPPEEPTNLIGRDIDPGEILVIQPPNGGTSNEDCGDGNPISFNRDEWNRRGMNDIIVKFWNDGTGSQHTSFDFHQAWAQKYGSDLYCRLASESCQGSFGVCSNLKGDSVADKQVGLLGLRAINNAQSYFVEMDKAIERGTRNLVGVLADFQATILEGGAQPFYSNDIFQKVFTIGMGITSIGLALTPGASVASDIVSNVGSIVSTLIENPDDDPLKNFSDVLGAWGKAQNMMHMGLNLSHSAIFSNGDVGNGQTNGPEHTLPHWMWDGAMVDSQSYTSSFGMLDQPMTRLMAARLLESALIARGAFVIFLEGHQGECAKWNGCKFSGEHAKPKDCYGFNRYCHRDGIFIPLMIGDDGRVKTIEVLSRIDQWASFDFDQKDLLNSAAWTYQDYGLDGTASADDFRVMVDAYQSGDRLEGQRGGFRLPVCKIAADHAWQPDKMMQFNQPPCDCLGLPDRNGKFIKDYVNPNVQKWLEKKCV